jgi:hypothetical protein
MKRAWMLGLLFFGSLSLMAAQDDKPEAAKAKKDDEKKGDDAEMKKEKGEEPEKPENKAKPTAPKMPDFSAYAKHSEHAGEVIKADENGLTVRQQSRVRQGNGFRTVNNDMDFQYAEGGMARREKAPKFFNDKGLERPGTSSELQALKAPQGAPGYHIERTDLKVGDLVKLELVRPRTISATKVKPEDLKIKYAIMVGENPKPTAPKK